MSDPEEQLECCDTNQEATVIQPGEQQQPDQANTEPQNNQETTNEEVTGADQNNVTPDQNLINADGNRVTTAGEETMPTETAIANNDADQNQEEDNANQEAIAEEPKIPEETMEFTNWDENKQFTLLICGQNSDGSKNVQFKIGEELVPQDELPPKPEPVEGEEDLGPQEPLKRPIWKDSTNEDKGYKELH